MYLLQDLLGVDTGKDVASALDGLRPFRDITDGYIRNIEDAGFLLNSPAVREQAERGPFQADKVKESQRLNKPKSGTLNIYPKSLHPGSGSWVK